MHGIIHQFFNYLGVTGRIQVVDEILCRRTVGGLGDAVAVAVVLDGDGSVVHALQAVLEVVLEGAGAAYYGVAVVVVLLGGHHAVIGVVAERAVPDSRQ
ncbi:MAG: hypothetical protein ABSG25_09010 [Bryobacteraceae bacterium]